MKYITVIAAGLMLCACATTQDTAMSSEASQTESVAIVAASDAETQTAEDNNSDEPRVVCRRERPTGSNRPVRRCYRVDDSSDAQDSMSEIQRGSAGSPGNGIYGN